MTCLEQINLFSECLHEEGALRGSRVATLALCDVTEVAHRVGGHCVPEFLAIAEALDAEPADLFRQLMRELDP